jgi:hypothetical protein
VAVGVRGEGGEEGMPLGGDPRCCCCCCCCCAIMIDMAARAFSAANIRLLFCSSGEDRGGSWGGGGPRGPPIEVGTPAAALTIAKNGDDLKRSAAVWGSSMPG